ncbi:helix-turn-helix domain-containing protein [uncultured Fibrobacter sp.]|jgi:cytoskeletal protein RodZ|uniref:helix-turn-helix domain-containing protein n=1 Tax=uncultured Fibrobacter sp. TaxID=261512 RepID=UPI0026013145|nr:helix-turn-helix domain-containing protein [uncultured Fibrobacter sp.]
MIQLEEKNPNERLGDFLARVRESQGLTIDDLSERTKISVKMLHFIESSDWKSLPVEAYVRSYLNSVSSKLGLDAKAVLKMYAEEVGSSYEIREAEPIKNIAPMTEDEKKPRSKAVPIAIVVILALLIVGLHFVNREKAASDASANPPAAVAAEESAEVNQDMPEGAEAVPVDSVKNEKVTQAEVDKAVKKAENLPASATIFISSTSKKDTTVTGPVSDNGRTRIELVGSGEMRSWVGIKRDEDDDDFVKEANIATVDNKLVYTASGTLYIVIGEPRAIGKMYLNGVETPVPVPKFGRVARFSVYDGRVLK